MPEVHVPDLEDDETADEPAKAAPAPAQRPKGPGAKSLVKIGLEVVLISAGVFLGLMGEQWREHAQHRDIAETSLRRFRQELQANRQAVASVKDRHAAKLQALSVYFQAIAAADASARQKIPWPDTGTDPAFLEYSAWDLAIATQSLAYIEPDVALSLAHVYAIQRQLDEATRGVTHAMYAASDPLVFVRNGLATYFGDCTLIEPRLLAEYDELLPKLDRALGDNRR